MIRSGEKGGKTMSGILQLLIKNNSEEALKLLDLADGGNMMDPDYNEIYHQIIELGKSAYGAAKAVENESPTTKRNFRTLFYHAKDIEKLIIESLSGITIRSLMEELMKKGKVSCPRELLGEFERALKDLKSRRVEKEIVFRLLPAYKITPIPHNDGEL